MGKSRKSTLLVAAATALFPKARQRVLAVLFGNTERSYYGNEIITLAQCGTGAVQRELASLVDAGLLTVTRVGNQKHFQANADAPAFADLRALVSTMLQLPDDASGKPVRPPL